MKQTILMIVVLAIVVIGSVKLDAYLYGPRPVTLLASQGITTERVVVSQTLTTLDGRTFRDFKVVHPVADGVLIEFVPVPKGYGMATVKWADLPVDAQKELGRYVRK